MHSSSKHSKQTLKASLICNKSDKSILDKTLTSCLWVVPDFCLRAGHVPPALRGWDGDSKWPNAAPAEKNQECSTAVCWETSSDHRQASVMKHQGQNAPEVMCAWRATWVILNDTYHIGHLHFSVVSPVLDPAVNVVYFFPSLFVCLFVSAASYLLLLWIILIHEISP